MKAAGRAEPVGSSSPGATEVTSSSEVRSIKQEAYGQEGKWEVALPDAPVQEGVEEEVAR